MRVKGTKTVTSVEEVEVDPREFVEAIRRKWVASHKDVPWEAYINDKGVWETWQDTHGSGITDNYRRATPEELIIYKAFDTVIGVINARLQD